MVSDRPLVNEWWVHKQEGQRVTVIRVVPSKPKGEAVLFRDDNGDTCTTSLSMFQRYYRRTTVEEESRPNCDGCPFKAIALSLKPKVQGARVE
jgi:hypothetical protein